MQTAAILINVLKDSTNLLKNVDLYLNSSSISSVIVITSSSKNKDTVLSHVCEKCNIDKLKVLLLNDNTISYAEMIKTAIDNITEKHCFIVPDTIVTTDKFIPFAVDSLKSDSDFVLLSRHDNKVLSNLEKLDHYNLYKVYNLNPDVEDFYNIVLLDKNLVREAPLEFKSHYLFYYISHTLLQQNNHIISVVNEMIKVNSSEYCIDFALLKEEIETAKQYDLIKVPRLSFFDKFFSLKKMNGRFYLSLFFFRVNFKLKLKPKFPKDAREFEYSENPSKYIQIHNACIFASFTANGKVSENTIRYLKSIKKQFDYLVYVADSKCTTDTFNVIKSIADAVFISRHNEYDFGSYKIGFNHLRKQKLLDKIDNLLLCNDSVDFVGCNADFSEIISRADPFDAFSLCMATYGFGERIKNSHRYDWVKYPHLQSYFLILKKNVFSSDYFSTFIDSVTYQKHKTDIIKLYEMGLTKVLSEHNVSMSSYYPYDDTNIVNPYAIYLNQYVDKPIFVKHMLAK